MMKASIRIVKRILHSLVSKEDKVVHFALYKPRSFIRLFIVILTLMHSKSQ